MRFKVETVMARYISQFQIRYYCTKKLVSKLLCYPRALFANVLWPEQLLSAQLFLDRTERTDVIKWRRKPNLSSSKWFFPNGHMDPYMDFIHMSPKFHMDSCSTIWIWIHNHIHKWIWISIWIVVISRGAQISSIIFIPKAFQSL